MGYFTFILITYCLLLSGVRRGGSLIYPVLLRTLQYMAGLFLLLFLHCVTLQLDRYIKYKSGQWPVGYSSVLVVGTH